MTARLRRLFRRKFVQDTIILQIGKIGVSLLGVAAWVIVPVRLGPYNYGLFALAQSFLGIWLTLDLTGLNVSIPVLLSTAIGAKDEREILDLLAVYLKIATLWALFTLVVLLPFGPALAALFYRDPVTPAAAHGLSYELLAGLETTGNPQVGALAALLALTQLFDPIYSLFLSAFRSRRSMRQMALMQNINQLVLTVCLVAAAFISPTAEGQVAGRVVYSVATLLIIVVMYQRTLNAGPVPYPPLRAVLRRSLTVSYRRYWRFGLANGLDKNISGLYTQIPLQVVGILSGPAAASFIQLGLRGIQRTGFFTSAVFENMQAVVPQAVGRGDYVHLWRDFMRVLVVLTLGGLGFYALVIIFAPLLVVPIFGADWEPILPLLPVFAIYGVTTTVGAIFGPLYRALDLMRAALITKVVALVVMLPLGYGLIQESQALGGVWMIDGLYLISVALTLAFTLPALRRRAHLQRAGTPGQ